MSSIADISPICATDCRHKDGQPCVPFTKLDELATSLRLIDAMFRFEDEKVGSYEYVVDVPTHPASDTKKFITVVQTDTDRRVAQGMADRFHKVNKVEKGPTTESYTLRANQIVSLRLPSQQLVNARVLGFVHKKDVVVQFCIAACKCKDTTFDEPWLAARLSTLAADEPVLTSTVTSCPISCIVRVLWPFENHMPESRLSLFMHIDGQKRVLYATLRKKPAAACDGVGCVRTLQ